MALGGMQGVQGLSKRLCQHAAHECGENRRHQDQEGCTSALGGGSSCPRLLKTLLLQIAGTTHATFEVLNRFTEGHDPDIVLLAGDHTCANALLSAALSLVCPCERGKCMQNLRSCVCLPGNCHLFCHLTHLDCLFSRMRRYADNHNNRPAILGRVVPHAAAQHVTRTVVGVLRQVRSRLLAYKSALRKAKDNLAAGGIPALMTA